MPTGFLTQHPRGLSTLFFTEMWERFSYYGMRAFLILYMTAPATAGGLGFSDADASSIYGLYTGSVWAAAILGGLVADRILGQYRSVLAGGVVIAAGHFVLAFDVLSAFYLGLVLIVIGTGLLKPNVSTLVGSLYSPGDARRDAGFSLFYMGINLGAFLGPIIAGYLAQRVNWHVGFGAAGVGMTLGLVQYVLGSAPLRAAEQQLKAKPTGAPGSRPALERPLRRRLQTHGRRRRVFRVRVDFLGRVRAGRIDAESLRGSLHAPGSVRASASPRHGSSRCRRSS